MYLLARSLTCIDPKLWAVILFIQPSSYFKLYCVTNCLALCQWSQQRPGQTTVSIRESCLFTCASDHVRLGQDVCGALAFALDNPVPVAAGNPLTGCVFVYECQQEPVRQTASCPTSSCWSLVLVNTLHGKPDWDGHWWLAPTDTWPWRSVSVSVFSHMIAHALWSPLIRLQCQKQTLRWIFDTLK